jgi:hypothetical protein
MNKQQIPATVSYQKYLFMSLLLPFFHCPVFLKEVANCSHRTTI